MAENTYSSKPFISYDGKDQNGLRAEVKIVTGYGRIKSIDLSDKGNSSKVTFKVDNTKYDVSGWSRDSSIMKLIEKSKETDEPIHFRVEQLRKEHVDRSLPIMDLTKGAENAKDNARKSLAAVKFEDDEEWTISSDAKTRLDEDPSRGGGSPSAYDMAPEDLKQAQSDGGYRGNFSRKLEAPPFEEFNPGGELNPGSVAVAAPLNIFSYILEYEKDHDIKLSRDGRKKLSTEILKVANNLQHEIYRKVAGIELEKPMLTSGSHTRARALIFESIRSFHPITIELESDDEALDAWKRTLTKTSLSMWEWAMEEIDSVLDV